MKKVIYLFVTISIMSFMLSACSKKVEVQGQSMINYPDIKVILSEYLDTEEPILYTKIVDDNGEKDTTRVSSERMDWKAITEIFLNTNIHDSAFDGKYNINKFDDTTMHAFTLHLTALDPTLETREMSINANDYDYKIRSVYIETADPGFFRSTYQKLLFIPKSTIQIQERSKTLFFKEKIKVTSYKYK